MVNPETVALQSALRKRTLGLVLMFCGSAILALLRVFHVLARMYAAYHHR